MPRTLVQNTVPGDTMIFVVTSHLKQKGIFVPFFLKSQSMPFIFGPTECTF